MAFDVEGARKAGYSDAEIVDHLAGELKFDAAGARKSGYTDAELLAHMAKPTAASQPIERSYAERFLHGLTLGTRDVIEGAAALPGLAVDAATWPGRALIRAAGGTATAPSDMLSQGLTMAGVPEAETDAERLSSGVIRGASGVLAGSAVGVAPILAGSAARFVPGAVGAPARFVPAVPAAAPTLVNALTTNIPTQVAAGAAGGGAGEAAHQGGYGPLTQAGASLLAGLGTAGLVQGAKAGWAGANALLAPFRQAGREEIATNVLLQGSSQPGSLQSRLAGGADLPRLPGSPVTTAQQARDPGLLPVELGMRSDVTAPPGVASPAARFRDVDARRNATRGEALDAMADGSNPGSRGATVRTALEESKTTMGESVGQQFDAARPEGGGAYPIGRIQEVAEQATAKFSKEQMGGGVPTELQAVIDDIAAAKGGTMTFDQIQNVRSRLGEIAGKAAREGDSRLSGAAGSVMKALEDEADSPAWQAAIKARRDMGAALDRSETGAAATGQILNKDRFGRPILADEKVAERALADVGNLRQTLGAVDKAIADARAAGMPAERIAALEEHAAATRQALQGQFVANLTKRSTTTGGIADAAGNVSDVLSPAGFANFMKDHGAVAAELFDPRQLANLRLLAADFAETSMAQTTSKALGSPTAQNLSVGNFISKVSRGLIDPGHPLSQTVAGVGPVMKWIYAAPEAATRALLTEAMVNPQFAQALLARASPEAMRRATGYIEQTMGQRFREAVGTAAGRQGVRETESDANRLAFPAPPRNRLAP